MKKEVINSFPGYEYIPGPENKGKGRNMFRGVDLGFGGYVYAVPGIYVNVAMLDVANMHGESIERLNYFGDYTKRYAELRKIRNCIKHRDFETPRKMFGGKLAKYLNDEESADNLSNALKLPCNQAYGISYTDYQLPTMHSMNKNNIVALRGALFMKTLQDEVTEMGYKVIHIKTDSIKIANADDKIIEYCMNRASDYGYLFEHECTYDRICLVNNSTYIAKYDDKGVRNKGGKKAGQWVAVADQFQVPYVFKSLFSHEDIEFDDLCETKSVAKGELYLDMNEDLPRLTREEEIELDKIDKAWHSKAGSKPLEDLAKKLGYTFEQIGARYNELCEKEAKTHNYVFVGRVGRFCPVKEGTGGGVLYRYQDGKYYAAAGTKGYRWLESEMVKTLGKEGDIDESYYNKLVDEAIDAIMQYGDFNIFANAEHYIYPDFINEPTGDPDVVPWDPNDNGKDPADSEHPKDG